MTCRASSNPHRFPVTSDGAVSVPGHGVVCVVPCHDLDASLEFFLDELGFRIEVISPADGPRTALLSGHGTLLRLQSTGDQYQPVHLQVRCADDDPRVGSHQVAPNGSRIEFVSADPEVSIPPLHQDLVVTTLAGNAAFGTGRASMGYRDLVPGRQGGRFIASHIRINEAGPVPDYVHFHKVRFQMIFVYRGWVRLVYEDQGEPFVMQAGDCVLQPPTIRHRVLESSAGLEVIEIACPAEHDTIAEHVIELPTGRVLPDREFGGQLFVHHRSGDAGWMPFRYDGFVEQDLGIGHATHGLAGARVIRCQGGDSWPTATVPNEFLFVFVMDGSAQLAVAGRAPQPVTAGDCFVIPSDLAYGLQDVTADARFLEVSLPADLRPLPA